MTSLPSPSRSTRSLSLLPLLVAAIPLLLVSACADKHIGRPCMTGLPASPDQVQSYVQALECPSRICLQPAQDKGLDPAQKATGAFCTDYCSSDDDCADGEKRGSDNPAGCLTGFACRTPVGNISSDPLRCKRLCVCKDFLKNGDPDKPPAGCGT